MTLIYRVSTHPGIDHFYYDVTRKKVFSKDCAQVHSIAGKFK